MPTDTARPYHHGDLHQALLAQALHTVSQGGASELSLRAVAKAAGVAPAAVYRHFADKRALLSACAAEGFDRMVAMIEARIEAAPDTAMRKYRAVGEGYLEFALTEPHLFRLMFAGDVTDRSDPALSAALARLSGLTGAGLKSLNAETQELRTLSWSVVHGLAMLAIDGQLDAFLTDAATPAEKATCLTKIIRHIGPALEAAAPP